MEAGGALESGNIQRIHACWHRARGEVGGGWGAAERTRAITKLQHEHALALTAVLLLLGVAYQVLHITAHRTA